ncbi:hypothetical protein ACLF4G_000874 [Cronobacter sakazakii]|nr:hypothetical protein [Cronobacter sakazakii]ELY3417136.1 hypothetical protein [Cronobacter sakazakii]MBF4821274.1 hypothetical protein [Cronobacter sakazakii]MBF4825156.1 hypothetical protein [Cronobacter sakazakii]HDK7352942.1 hypothetical protein [Cronobacter sakazakii]
MNTISNEQAKDLRNAFKCWQQDYDPVEDKEQYDMFGLGVVAMDELLALRKERERAEPVAYLSKADVDAGYPHILARKEYSKACPMAVYTAPTEPSFSDDSLPYDPQIAEYEQMMEAEQAQADTTSQQFESLAGKAVVPAGWKLVPIEPTVEMQIAFAEAWFSKVRCVDDCELEDAYIAMLAVAPEPCK